MSRFTPPKAKRLTNLWAPLPSTKSMLTVTTTTTRTVSPRIDITTNPMMMSTCRICKRWGLPCPFCTQSVPHLSYIESNWSDEDWHRDKQRAREAKRREQPEQEKNEKGTCPMNIVPLAQCMTPHSKKTPYPIIPQRKSWP